MLPRSLGGRCLSLCNISRWNPLQTSSVPHQLSPSIIHQRRNLRLQPEGKSKLAGSPPFNNLTLYTYTTPNGLKPAIVLEELGLNYKVETVDLSKNIQKEPWYLEINPNGKIPALKDGDMRIFESGAIMLYLADHYDKDQKISYKSGTPEYYEMLSWLMFQVGGVGPFQGLLTLLNSANGSLTSSRPSESFPCHGRCLFSLWHQTLYG